MDTTITVYSAPSCVQCTATKRALDASDLEYEVVDVSTDEAAVAYLKELGFSQAPVVIVEGTGAMWSGFRPDRIADLALELEQQEVATC